MKQNLQDLSIAGFMVWLTCCVVEITLSGDFEPGTMMAFLDTAVAGGFVSMFSGVIALVAPSTSKNS